MKAYSNQVAYASHGHAIAANGATGMMDDLAYKISMDPLKFPEINLYDGYF